MEYFCYWSVMLIILQIFKHPFYQILAVILELVKNAITVDLKRTVTLVTHHPAVLQYYVRFNFLSLLVIVSLV